MRPSTPIIDAPMPLRWCKASGEGVGIVSSGAGRKRKVSWSMFMVMQHWACSTFEKYNSNLQRTLWNLNEI